MVFTKAKAWVAGIGSTLTAIVVAIGVLSGALQDNKIDGGEIATLISTAVTLVGTVYSVWRVPNKVVDKTSV